jgi:5'-nucleotidase (lipoprotein e(P4) family)
MKKLNLIFTVILFAGCYTPNKTTAPIIQQANLVIDGKMYTSVFQQRAAEYKALCLQAYNIARLRLDEALQQPSTKPKAIITDIDETVLDNSPYAVNRASVGKSYDQASWHEWTSRGIADTLAGSFSFFNYAASKNVEVFYITNRLEEERAGTLKNLQLYGFPNADNEHLLLKENTSSKEPRRQKVLANHEIVLLLGDNLADFSPLFDNKKSTAERSNATLQSTAEFGKKFIVLPNCNYGDWEGAIYDYHYGFTPAQKDSAVKANLKGY